MFYLNVFLLPAANLFYVSDQSRALIVKYVKTLKTGLCFSVFYFTFVLLFLIDKMELKERIIEKAGDLFQQYGVKNVSMDEIASSLGISKRTIYENFKDKEDILLSVLLRFSQNRETVFTSFVQQCNNVVEVFIKIIEIYPFVM